MDATEREQRRSHKNMEHITASPTRQRQVLVSPSSSPRISEASARDSAVQLLPFRRGNHVGGMSEWSDNYELLRPFRVEDTAYVPSHHQYPLHGNHRRSVPILPCRYKPTGELRAVKIIKKSRWTQREGEHADVADDGRTSFRDSAVSTMSSLSNYSASPSIRESLDFPRYPLRASHYRNHWNRRQLQEFSMLKALRAGPHMMQAHELLEDEQYYYMILEAAAITAVPNTTNITTTSASTTTSTTASKTIRQLPHFVSLVKALKQRGQFTESATAIMMKQILEVIHYCHEHQIVLCDLKMDSFLFHQDESSSGQSDDKLSSSWIQLKFQTMEHAVLLSDLSTMDHLHSPRQQSLVSSPELRPSLDHSTQPVRRFTTTTTASATPPRQRLRLVEPRGTVRFMAPEVVAHDQTYGLACDIWSAGIICFVLIAGNFPLDATRSHDIQERILSTLEPTGQPHQWLWDIMKRDPTWAERSEACRSFVACLLNPQEARRVTAHSALHHPWLTSNARQQPPSDLVPAVDPMQARTRIAEILLNPQAGIFHQLDRDMHAIVEDTESQNKLMQSSPEPIEQPLSTTKQVGSPSHPPEPHRVLPRTSTWPRPALEREKSPSLQGQFRAIENFIVKHYQIQNERIEIEGLLKIIGIEVADDSATLSQDNVRVAYSHLFKRTLEQDELEKVFAQLDAKGTGRISFMEFVVAVMNEKELLFSRDLLDYFDIFDVGRTGLVSTAYLAGSLQAFWEQSATFTNINPQDRAVVRAIMDQVAANEHAYGEKYIDLEEFVAILLETAFADDAVSVTNVDAMPLIEEEKASSDPYYATNTSFGSIDSGPLLNRMTSGGSVMSTRDQTRQSTISLLDRLSLRFTAANFIVQRPGRLTHHYEIDEFINEGGCGAIWLCRHRGTGSERAVKVVKRTSAWEGDAPSEADHKLLLEFNILRNLDHPNILRMYELFSDTACYYIVMDVAKGGDLCDELDEYGAFVEAEAARLMKQLLSCVNYCHDQHIVHCDLKPENVLLEDNHELSQLKIIDFGFAANLLEHQNHRLTKQWGTLSYCAPELLCGNYGAKVDVWACGVITFLLLSDEFPFWGSREEMVAKICNGSFSFKSPVWGGVSEAARDFVTKLLQVDEDLRPTAAEALWHPWIKSITQVTSGTFRRYGAFMAARALHNLQRFKCRNKLQMATYSFIASQLVSTREKQVVDDVFRAIDTRFIGKIGKEELMSAWTEYLGAELTKEAADEIFANCDVTGTGFIEYSQFVVAAMDGDLILSDSNLQKAFQEFDVDKIGYITRDNLKIALSTALTGNELLDNAVLDKMLQEVNICQDKRICFDEFVAIMRNTVVVNHDNRCPS